jgi:hypothetical protein
MRDRNTYHLSMEFTGGIPTIHGDVHRPSDYIIDKIYLLSKISDVLEINRTFGVIEGFELINPIISPNPPTGSFQDFNYVEYSINTTTNSSFQLDDGYVLISHKFKDNITTHGKSGVGLTNPVPLTHYFGIVYCPKEFNLINIASIPNGNSYLYIKYKYDTRNVKLYLTDVSREREKTALPQIYTFLGGDFYEWQILSSLKLNTDPDYENYVLVAELNKTGTTLTLKLKGYSSLIKLSKNLHILYNKSTDPKLSLIPKNLDKRVFNLNFDKIYNKLNSSPDYSIIEQKFDNINGKLLLDSRVLIENSILNNNSTYNFKDFVSLNSVGSYSILRVVDNTSNKELTIKFSSNKFYIEYTDFIVGINDPTSEISIDPDNRSITNKTGNILNVYEYGFYTKNLENVGIL